MWTWAWIGSNTYFTGLQNFYLTANCTLVYPLWFWFLWISFLPAGMRHSCWFLPSMKRIQSSKNKSTCNDYQMKIHTKAALALHQPKHSLYALCTSEKLYPNDFGNFRQIDNWFTSFVLFCGMVSNVICEIEDFNTCSIKPHESEIPPECVGVK